MTIFLSHQSTTDHVMFGPWFIFNIFLEETDHTDNEL